MSPGHVAQDLGRPLAAMPGRVTSPASRGAHELLIEGAHLVRDATDVLGLLRERHELSREGSNSTARRAAMTPDRGSSNRATFH